MPAAILISTVFVMELHALCALIGERQAMGCCFDSDSDLSEGGLRIQARRKSASTLAGGAPGQRRPSTRASDFVPVGDPRLPSHSG